MHLKNISYFLDISGIFNYRLREVCRIMPYAVCRIGFCRIILRISLYKHKNIKVNTQPAITCSKLTIETLEQGVKYVQ